MKNFLLGIDLGSVSLKIVVMLPAGEIIYTSYIPTGGKPQEAALNTLKDLHKSLGDIAFAGIIVTGSGKALIAECLGLPSLNEIVTHARACWEQFPDVGSIIEIGGQDSKYIEIARRGDGRPFIERHAFNGLCSAGTGAFLDHQAQRLGLGIEEFSLKAASAAYVPPIAGRCSVFAKSDMIHLQQKGITGDAISAGLCHALARNYIATLCKGKPPAIPVVFQGGVAANQGMRRAFASILGIGEDELIIPEHHKIMGAIGAALFAHEQPLEKPMALTSLINVLVQVPPLEHTTKKPRLSSPTGEKIERHALKASESAYLGLDVGSVTTKAVLMTAQGELIAYANVPTRSNPIEAGREVLVSIGRGFESPPRISGFYATGSGRHLVRGLYGVDGCIDEISAQARSVRELNRDVDTIIEIGGQDSKFIRLKDGEVHDFVMNRMCAAGTGSFLAEQADRLKVDIEDEFAALAIKAQAPVNLGTRCTVFMDSDLVHHIQLGKEKQDLCAGLAYSIAQNYLDMVVRSRPIGTNVIFQGGVASNAAVHAAFEAILERPITVHPYPTHSGAIGAALIARDEMADRASCFSGFMHLDQHYALESFVCSECENACEIKRVKSERPASFGSICGKYETVPHGKNRPESLFSLRRRWLFDDYPVRTSRHARGDIGLPLGIGMHEQLPFWKTFFAALGFNPVVSGATTRAIAEQGAQKLPVETCMSVKILYGHALHLAGKGYRLFVPHTAKQKPDGENEACFLCPYAQASGYIIRSKICRETIILSYPGDAADDGWVHAASRAMAIDKREVAGALEQARAAMREFKRRCRAHGQLVLKDLSESQKTGIVIIGRPYVLGDSYITMDLSRQLERLGNVPIPMDFLDMDKIEVPSFFEDMHWYMGRQALKAAEYVRGNKNLACISLTTFGCGPDAFICQYLESVLQHAPHLVLEFDEHRADTGMVTRLEAFLRTLGPAERFTRADVYLNKGPVCKDRSLRDYRYFIQHFSDHAYAFAGSLRAVGCQADVLPETDDSSIRLAKGYAHGNECHPYHSVLGDLLRLVAQPGFNPAGAAYFSPKYDGPCLLNQYGTAIRIIMENIGAGDVALLNIGNMAVMDELFPVYPVYLARSSYAIDRLSKWAAEIRPYERRHGEVRAVHQHNMELLLQRMQQRRLDAGIREAVASMQAIALSERRDLPVIGIVGDIYTRLNAHANFGLADKLNANGFEVWTSALIMDVVLLGYEQRSRDLLDRGQRLKGIIARGYLPAARILRASVDRYFPDIIRTPQESPFPDVNRRIASYIDHRVDKFISLNINRIGEFRQAGADGVLNVMCPGCMVGTVSEAFFPELRRQYADLPLESLSFGDQQSTHVDNRLEAFCYLVKESRTRTG